MKNQLSRSVVVAVALAVFGAGVGPVLADKPDKNQDKKHDKNAAKHEQQQAKKAEQQAAQAQHRAHKHRQDQIAVHRARASAYDRRLVEQTRLAEQRRMALRASKRDAQYQYQQEYLARLKQQQQDVKRAYDYDKDPYYTTAPAYRYVRGGRTYQVNQFAADQLQLAVNSGYEQGVRAGQADHQDQWNQTRYQDSWGYQDATYGFNGNYVAMDEYQYYFRQGFQRGYQDGLGSRYQYGTNQGGQISLLRTVLTTILNLQSLQ
jgi:hypothetical protein